MRPYIKGIDKFEWWVSMEIIDRQRELLKFIGLAKPGNVLEVHYTHLRFGNAGKPYHFAVNITYPGTTLETVFLVPVSSQLYQKRHFVTINLSKHSDLNGMTTENLDMEAYALVSLARQVKVENLFVPPPTAVRGLLHDNKLQQILQARKEYILRQFSKINKGDVR